MDVFNNYNFISIGEFCLSSYFIKTLELKKQSYPFDWVYSNINTVLFCIGDDFKCIKNNINEQKNDIINDDIYFTIPHNDLKNNNDREYFYRCIISIIIIYYINFIINN